MKRISCFAMTFLLVVMLGLPAHAADEQSLRFEGTVYSYTMGEAQAMLHEYLKAQDISLEPGSVEYYTYICNQLLERADENLAALPNYSIIHSYMAMYKNAYESALWLDYNNLATEENASRNATTASLFTVDDDFLNETIGDIRDSMLQEETAARVSTASVLSTQAYSATSAVNYAREYATDYNTAEYPSFKFAGGDCTNFVSQCLHAGGKSMDGTCTSAGVYQDISDWFMKKIEYQDSWSYMVDYGYSTSWVNAGDFKTYWLSRCDGYSYETDVDGIISACSKGDIVQLCDENTRVPYHSIIVTYKSGTTAKYCGHSSDRLDYAISEANLDSDNNDFIVYNF